MSPAFIISSCLPLQFVKQLAAKGNKVVACCRQPDPVKEKLQSLGDVIVTKVDIANPSSIESWAQEVAQLVPRVDVVINNAGIYGPRGGIDDISAQDMLNVFKVNAVGPFLVVQQLRRNGLIGGAGGKRAVVANVTSKVGSIEDNKSGSRYPYRASKAALNIVNKSLSIDLAEEGVVSTLLHPGECTGKSSRKFRFVDVCLRN
jgi:NAD(P)-dependent dehydrogenase (short-subunit alcohol dehydrogenase family)